MASRIVGSTATMLNRGSERIAERRFSVLVIMVCLAALAPRPAAAQTGCTPDDSLTTQWVQGVLDGSISADSREYLGLAHLTGQKVNLLGSDPEDDAVCDAILMGLTHEERSKLETTLDTYEVAFYQVGDRFLLVWGPQRNGPPQLRPSIIVSFDEQFKKIAASMW